MNHLQKKCFIASAGFHLLLLVVLFVGPAFFSGNKIQDTQVLTFFDLSKVTDGPTTGTGNPNPQPPAQVREIVQPLQPTPQPVFVKPKDPAPPERTEKDSLATKPKPKIEISTRLVPRSATRPNNKPANNDDSDAKAREQAAKLAAAFRSAASGLKTGLSRSTAVELPSGNGEAGSVNWAQAVVSIYYDAWRLPDELAASDNLNTKVSITIAADGDVVSARITKPSGNSAADASVQGALNRVKSTVPFPPGAKNKERTITINFNPLIKKQAG